MTVLIVTHSRDHEGISLVMEAIAAQGGKAFRFDTDRFPTQAHLEVYFGLGTERFVLIDGANQLNLQNVSAVWYRRIRMGARIPTTMDAQLRQASVQESQATILGAIASLDVFHLDSVSHIRRAEHKQLQLQIARSLGLETPRTLITNNPQAVLEFAQECGSAMVTKMLTTFAIYDRGQEQVVFTNSVKSEDLENLEGLRFCPMCFQENIPKALELRTTIVGQHVFTAAIDSQISPEARHDWRRQGLSLIDAWQPYNLPQEIATKLLKLMAYFQLNYGAFDLILTPDGRYIFLEINPVGEFYWLEKHAGLPISQAIADILIKSPPFQGNDT
ncbi:MvdD family ATP-grasp ribosomal peptide maturase [Chroococcidiopsis sp.]|uniref:MvdD family ATP-grasp ribosomal peptide maturase n=1 Tax=Chroococcidiopsis sp. TaxID=3088168 RepID=UPI003F3E2754